MIRNAPATGIRSALIAALLATALGVGCGSDGVAYDRLYLSITSDAPAGGGAIDSLRVLVASPDGSVHFPAAPGDPDFNLNLTGTGLDPVAAPIIVQVQYSADTFAASDGLANVVVTGYQGGGPVVLWQGQANLAAKSLLTVHLGALSAANPADCDADGDGFLDCNVAGCCPTALDQAFADCEPADEAANPWGVEPDCEPCDDTVDNDCKGGDQACVDEDDDDVADCYEAAQGCGVGDKDVAPGKAEACDDIDNDCDGQTDDGFVLSYNGQVLGKGDACGTGACAGGTVVCASADALACSTDGNKSEEECGNSVDDDCDGDTDEGCSVNDLDGDGQAPPTDCNDYDSGIYDGAPEPCCLLANQGDPAAELLCDKDCDGSPTWCEVGDTDGDGYTEAEGDCDDTDPLTYPGAVERCGDGVDQDCLAGDVTCDGLTDGDEDGWPAGVDCRDDDEDIYPGAVEVCDGVDNDCSGAIDDGNPGGGADCGSAVGACELGVEVCLNSSGDNGVVRCIGDIRPVDELCDDVDNDCDDSTDEDFTWSDLPIGASCDGVGACGLGTVECTPGSTSEATCSTNPDGSAAEDELEVCDQLDNDCDGTVNEDLHSVTDSTCKKIGVCGVGQSSIQATCDPQGVWQCNYANVPGYEDAVEASCDGKDNDCDGGTDDEFFIGTGCDGDDEDSCFNGVVKCDPADVAETYCDESQAQEQVELCDGQDNDCDGKTDEDFKPGEDNTVTLLNASYPTDNGKTLGMGCGTGTCVASGAGTVSCDPANPTRLICYTLVQPATDVCDDKDNDCNGVTDDIYQPGGTVKFNGGPYAPDAGKGKGQTCGTGSCDGGQVVCASTSTLTCSTLGNVGTDACDDEDNNCNGSVDEGFPNLDSDAQADCVDADDDGDGVPDIDDACKLGVIGWTSNATTDHDGDGCRDDATEDTDDDNDGKLDAQDTCPRGDLAWTSNATSDHDGDGCRDAGEDTDDDNDGVLDGDDDCPSGDLNWTSNQATTDHDSDGCRDASTEDTDDDNDGVLDGNDACSKGDLGWTSAQASTDHDTDGCRDDGEDTDDDDDGLADGVDDCARGDLSWTSSAATDHDTDGCRDESVEDDDDDNDGLVDTSDDCARGDLNWTSAQATTDHDTDGCRDAGEDTDDDNDGVLDGVDDCAKGDLLWTSNAATTDHDTDGCRDAGEDTDDDDDGKADGDDDCAKGDLGWTSNGTTDHDDDGCRDTGEDADDDNDGKADTSDACPRGDLNWATTPATDHDSDGCRDAGEDTDDDNDGVLDGVDDCALGNTGWLSGSGTDHDTDGCQDDSSEDTDDDDDGKADGDDDCARGDVSWTSNGTTDHDDDGCRDAGEDTDDDNDGRADGVDACAKGDLGWTSDGTTDHDSDGCRDASSEDTDDDNDGKADGADDCAKGDLSWTSSAATDHDSDGCRDDGEDQDDDDDGKADTGDACPRGDLNWTASIGTDHDSDGCRDDGEDLDDDNDGVLDIGDDCARGNTGWLSASGTDHDTDGCQDSTGEDTDDDNDGVDDGSDDCPTGDLNWTAAGSTDHDSDGCRDDGEDTDDDNDSKADGADACGRGDLNWTSSAATDHDSDGCRDDGSEDLDDDNDGKADGADSCGRGDLNWISSAGTDHDSDGCRDDGEDTDDDGDGKADGDDDCARGDLGWFSDADTDYDDDGCRDTSVEDLDDDNDGVADVSDSCPEGDLGWTSSAGTDHDGDGCRDASTEDTDDDDDGLSDPNDDCPLGDTGWTSEPGSDYDGDGCRDATEDDDDDDDTVDDGDDDCPTGEKSWISSPVTDYDSDGCQDDSEEDADDDNDGVFDELPDQCPKGDLDWTSNAGTDHDGDGCRDASTEDPDDDNDGVADDHPDLCHFGNVGWTSNSGTDHDGDGCQDGTSEETDDDNDGVLNDHPDLCLQGNVGWTSNSGTDHDGDGCQDGTSEETDDDNDGVLNDHPDLCLQGNLGWTSNSGTDYDGDGCQDGTSEETDDDNDGVLNDHPDLCQQGNKGWTSTAGTDYDGDGCQDGTGEELDNDNDGVLNSAPDVCLEGEKGWTSNGTTDVDTDGCRDATEDTCVNADADGWGRAGFTQTSCAFAGDDCDDTASNTNDEDEDNVCVNTGGATCSGGQTANCDDNCPDDANASQSDGDDDATGDVCDTCTDADGDGWGVAGLTQTGCGNSGDDCDDDAANSHDDDHDNICDTIYGATCGDGQTASCNDNCPGVANATQTNADATTGDADALGDACDPCTDADGDDFGRGGAGFVMTGCADAVTPDCDDAAANTHDDDHDNICDTIYGATCGDGVTTGCNDNCPAVANADQANADSDSGDSDALGDACDTCTDADGDDWGRAGLTQSGCAKSGDDCDDSPANVNDVDADNVCADTPGGPCDDGESVGCDDNCPANANAGQEDTDDDGTGDVCDTCTDADADGWGRASFTQTGCMNSGDDCDDAAANTHDDDHDNICDTIYGATCGDGEIASCNDNCPGVANATQTNADATTGDADALGDACDPCTDADGDDFGRGGVGFVMTACTDTVTPDCDDTPANAHDDDHDNICDTIYGATCGDGVTTSCNDNCPAVANADQANADSDSGDSDALGDACDTCTDADGDDWGRAGLTQSGCAKSGDDCDDAPANVNDVDADNVCADTPGGACDEGESVGCDDNCPANANAGQEDTDDDGTGDVCDTCTDADADGWGRASFTQTGCMNNGDDCNDLVSNTDDEDGDNICINLGANCVDGDVTACSDNCPDDVNADQADGDADGYGEVCDNCPGLSNDQTDLDGDGIGLACDTSVDTPGNNCGQARTLALATTEMGDTSTGMLTDAFDVGTCPDLGGGPTNDGGDDEVWAFTAAETAEYVVTLTPDSNNLFMYAYTEASCGDADCFGKIDNGGAGAADTLTLGLVDGQTYYIVVDSAAGAEDSYTIQVDKSECPPPVMSDLIISEYVEGGSFRKGIELFNGTGASVNLNSYQIRTGVNGGALGGAYTLGDHDLAPGATWLICYNGSGDLADVAGVTCNDLTSTGAMNFTGDDAVALTETDGTIIDLIGVPGVDPGSGWTVGTGSTDNHTLVRKSSVTGPASTWNTAEWDVYDQDTTDYLNDHTVDAVCPVLAAPAGTTPVDAPTMNDTTEVVRSCMAGYAAVGIHGFADTNADGIGLECEPLFLLSNFFGRDRDETLTVGVGSTADGPYLCPPGRGLVGLETRYATPFTLLHGRCLALADIAAGTAPTPDNTDHVDGAIQGSAYNSGTDSMGATFCPGGSVVVGLIGRVEDGGTALSQIALDCAAYPPPAP